MDCMTDAPLLLKALKVDLGITTHAFDDRLLDRLAQARELITTEGAVLTDSQGDRELVVMYAAYLWRERASGADMPRMLRYALNNRILNQKAGGGSA